MLLTPTLELSHAAGLISTSTTGRLLMEVIVTIFSSMRVNQTTFFCDDPRIGVKAQIVMESLEKSAIVSDVARRRRGLRP